MLVPVFLLRSAVRMLAMMDSQVDAEMATNMTTLIITSVPDTKKVDSLESETEPDRG
jgi:hypothetical protein